MANYNPSKQNNSIDSSWNIFNWFSTAVKSNRKTIDHKRSADKRDVRETATFKRVLHQKVVKIYYKGKELEAYIKELGHTYHEGERVSVSNGCGNFLYIEPLH
ncbi:MAG: hypothetical protein KDD63_24925 [Bacteroidetes bacterium]|nr:hypothetical protein [Bacteroidota bacterium]MCB0855501.1 hypothetical protein [Bacteroidota bacterium]